MTIKKYFHLKQPLQGTYLSKFVFYLIFKKILLHKYNIYKHKMFYFYELYEYMFLKYCKHNTKLNCSIYDVLHA